MSAESLLRTLLLSLLLTLIVELTFALCCKKRRFDLLLAALVNIATNPPVVLIYTLLRQSVRIPGLLLALPLELAAIAVEAFFYKRFADDIKRPLLFSLCANVLSYSTGLMLNILL